MDRNLVLNLVRVTEAAALGAAKLLGRGDKNMADQLAVDGMRNMFDTLDIDGTVVIGEGELDEAPMLYIGEKIGKDLSGSIKVDIAVDPVEGTTAVAKGLPNAIAVVAIAPQGHLLNAPDMYMDKIAVGPRAKGVINLDAPVKVNLMNVAKALNKDITDLTVTMLDRERHAEIIKECREAGTRIKLFSDGDVGAALATCFEHTGTDILFGIGGAPEGVITAAAIKCLGGDFQGRLIPSDEEEKERCNRMGVDFKKLFTLDDLVKGNEVFFAATGISDGDLLKGVTYHEGNKAKTHSVIMRGETGTIRFIESIHRLDKKPEYAR
ncbi:class II fructose-bisphosphatase [Anaerosolibacter sp.]|uniref:class II fructose-bisphosphatase n=1 Tax=Anaerosolibacter sp. TaxID=1872527 RepID=UPI0039EE8E6C